MKILQLAWENFGTADIKEAFEKCGHQSVLLKTSQEELLTPAISEGLEEAIKINNPDVIFGFNYFPNVAETCKNAGIDYFAWVYDNPCVQLYSCTVIYPTNHIFVFDSDTYLKFTNQGIKNIYYLPMAANPERIYGGSPSAYKYDISFVGSMYNEKHNFYSRMMEKGIDKYTEGYLRGIMEAQKLIYGESIVEKQLNDDILQRMYQALPLEGESDSVITRQTLFGEYVINRQITAEERLDMISTLGSQIGNIALFTPDSKLKIAGVNNYGPIDFYEGAPGVFANSKINLNISLRSIINGIPLRCFEIMGSGGFLLSDYAGDFNMFFEAGEDYVYFDSKKDLIEKAKYYLAHDDERKAIADNAVNKIMQGHTYVHRVEEMFG